MALYLEYNGIISVLHQVKIVLKGFSLLLLFSFIDTYKVYFLVIQYLKKDIFLQLKLLFLYRYGVSKQT